MTKRSFLAASLLLAAVAPAMAQRAPSSEPSAEAPAPPQRLRMQPRPFTTAEEGFAAFADAARTQNLRRMLTILGEDAHRLLNSGDPIADRADRERFANAYAERHEVRHPTPDRALLEVGADSWPLPIPMVRRDGRWRFDARAGGQELIDRRIGRNELDTTETLRAIADAQAEYARTAGRQGAFQSYARRFFSTPGNHDGLYWASAEGEPRSPLGPLLASASGHGYGEPRRGSAAPQPYHGYYFRILEGQGPAAPGGEFDYVVNGRMIGGFAAIAWPAQYRNSGIRTFLISHHGTVYERDLGPATARIVTGIVRFDPVAGWTAVP